MHNIILKLQPHILGLDKNIIIVEYSKYIGGVLYSKILI